MKTLRHHESALDMHCGLIIPDFVIAQSRRLTRQMRESNYCTVKPTKVEEGKMSLGLTSGQEHQLLNALYLAMRTMESSYLAMHLSEVGIGSFVVLFPRSSQRIQPLAK